MNSVQDETPIVEEKEVKKKNRRSFILMIAVFALPIILAKFALNGEWLATGVTNKGTLLTNDLTLEKLGINDSSFHEQWLMIYSLPQQCASDCQETLETVHNTYIALGRETPRVTPVALYQNTLSINQLEHISESHWKLLAMPSQAVQYVGKPQIFIVDPLGNVFLRHDIPANVEEYPQFGKNILADMKKLLKYSKVG